MLNVDWEDVPAENEYPVIEAGEYLCEVVECREKRTRNGDDMFSIQLKVLEGQAKNRMFFDNLVFSKAAKRRTKDACTSFGVLTKGKSELSTDMLVGKVAFVTVAIDDSYTNDAGVKVVKNTVPWDGYRIAPPQEGGAEDTGDKSNSSGVSEDDIPF